MGGFSQPAHSKTNTNYKTPQSQHTKDSASILFKRPEGRFNHMIFHTG